MAKFRTAKRAVCADIRDMDNVEFARHMDQYHWDEFLGSDMADMPGVAQADEWVNLYRIMHEQYHNAARDGEREPYIDHLHAGHSDTDTILEWCREKRRKRDAERDAIRDAAIKRQRR